MREKNYSVKNSEAIQGQSLSNKILKITHLEYKTAPPWLLGSFNGPDKKVKERERGWYSSVYAENQ